MDFKDLFILKQARKHHPCKSLKKRRDILVSEALMKPGTTETWAGPPKIKTVL